MNSPRRITDLDLADIECLMTLLDARLKTINTHIRKGHSHAETEMYKKYHQLASIKDKLTRMKERSTY